MHNHPKQSRGTDRLSPQKHSDRPRETDNKRLAEQIRKFLRKHYASKYRVR
jgi:hypothetical protein